MSHLEHECASRRSADAARDALLDAQLAALEEELARARAGLEALRGRLVEASIKVPRLERQRSKGPRNAETGASLHVQNLIELALLREREGNLLGDIFPT